MQFFFEKKKYFRCAKQKVQNEAKVSSVRHAELEVSLRFGFVVLCVCLIISIVLSPFFIT